MKNFRFSYILLLLLCNIHYSNAQEIITNQIGSEPVLNNVNSLLNNGISYESLFKNDVSSSLESTIFQEELDLKKYLIEKSNSTGINDAYKNNEPSNMLDKYNLKPSPGILSDGLPNFSEDLHYGKVNISIPLFDFKYYDYSIPVFLNNRYPQDIAQSFGDPIFYATTNVGGDWTLSVDQFKVSRQINGIEDENPTKGYFTSKSQNKVNNPSTISYNDVHTGLKGEWDTGIDVFHFSTPTISGSFLINMNTGSYEVLSQQKFHVEFVLLNNELNKFIITDNNGVQYVFGGDSSTIEVSQSISDVYSFGKFTDANYGKIFATHIVELINNIPMSIAELGSYANFFVNDVNPPYLRPSTNELLTSISQHSNQGTQLPASTLQGMVKLGETKDNNNNTRSYYAIASENQNNNLTLLPGGEVINDPEMKREKVNTGWYLDEIILQNNKKIKFLYQNTTWEAFRTFSINKVKVNMLINAAYNYIGYGNFEGTMKSIDIYPCFPENLNYLKFPINETYVETTHFVKRPSLWKITDEDNYSQLNLYRDIQNPKAYISDPRIYPNAPSETIFNGTPNYGLYSQISFSEGGEYQVAKFKNHADYQLYNDDGTIYRAPWKERSFLDELIINNRKKYVFEYQGSRLEKIHYPTGGVKELYSTSKTGSSGTYYNTIGKKLYNYIEGRVDSIVTISENNLTTEKYEFSNPLGKPVHSTLKTYRPDIAPCLTGATMTSTSPVYESNLKGGFYYNNIKKYVNNYLQSNLTFENHSGSSNVLYLTDESTPDYLDLVGRPRSNYDEKNGLLIESVLYKTNGDYTIDEIKSTSFTRAFNPAVFKYPSIYLTKIEAGPWQNTSGAIKRGYSTYYYPLDYDLTYEKKTDKEFFDNGNYITTENESFYKRTSIPQIGLNIYMPYRNRFISGNGDVLETNLFTPIEIENLSNSNLIPSNSVFSNLLLNNTSPILETLTYNNGKLTTATSNKYKLTPVNGNGERFSVISEEKMIELDDKILNQNNYTIQYLQSGNPENIIFDSSLKNKLIYDKYDADGRLLEYHNPDNNIYTSIIWGYKKQLPVAVLNNIRYSDIEVWVSSIQDYSNQSGSQNTLITKLNDLRNSLPNNVQIKTYTYVGRKLSTSTDVNGLTTYYNYNDYGELETIKDNNLNVVEKYTYNYKTLSNYTVNFTLSSINWLNYTNYLKIGNSISCSIIPNGGSGDYTYNWSFVRNNVIISSGTSQNSYLFLADENYTGSITLNYEVTDNYTGITLTKSRNFYVFANNENEFTLSYDNIQEDLFSVNTIYSKATVTSHHEDILRFWAFNMSTSGSVTVTINGHTTTLGNYETKTIEVPVESEQTIQCFITGSGSFNFATLEILNPVNGSANPVSPNILNLNNSN